jgi:hypothetical protein
MTYKILLSLAKEFAREKNLVAEHGATPIAEEISETKRRMLSNLKAIGKSGSLETIVAAEKAFVENDLKEYANSKNMASSLNTAQKELEAIEPNVGLLAEPEKYRHIDASNAQPKLRDGQDLPKDGARQAFRSHHARLSNYDKSKSDDIEKAIVHMRQQNIRAAEKLYIERQEQALGRNPKHAPKNNEHTP